jgi:hypothetical protein
MVPDISPYLERRVRSLDEATHDAARKRRRFAAALASAAGRGEDGLAARGVAPTAWAPPGAEPGR